MSNVWMSVGKLSRCRLLLLAVALGNAPVLAQPAGPSDAPGLRQVVDGYVVEAVRSNLALRQRELSVLQAAAALDEARAAWRPQLAFSARYTRAEGGREIEFPVGDLLNPVYRTLNDQLIAAGQPAQFPTLDNQVIPLLREREQDTRLSLRQALYQPALDAGIAVRVAGLDAEAAAREVYARGLIRDVRLAYYDWRRALSARAIVAASAELLEENLRVNRSLYANGKVTQDQVLRAEAELLAVQQQQREADNQIALARSYLNFLRNAELEAPLDARPAASFEVPTLPTLAEAQLQARRQRPELRQTAAGTRVAEASVARERAAWKPSLALAVDAGIQGENYGGRDQDFVAATLVLDLKLFDGGQRRARLAAAGHALEQAHSRHAEAADRIELDVQRARDSLATAADSLRTAEARYEAANAGFRIASRKRDAGAISQVEFLDARSALTSAELNRNLTRFEFLSRQADLALATASESEVLLSAFPE